MTLDEQYPNKRDVSIPLETLMLSAGRDAVILLIAPLVIYLLVWGFDGVMDDIFNVRTLLLAVPVTLAFVVIHELTHYIGWKFLSGLPFSAFSFGIDRQTLSPYCHAHAPMNATAYRIGAALPLIVTGIFPAGVALLNQDAALMLLSAFMISAAVGDLYVLRVIREVPGDARVIDHPKNAGCYVLE